MSIIKLLTLLVGLTMFGVLMGYHAYTTEYTTVRMVCIMGAMPTVYALYITIYDLVHTPCEYCGATSPKDCCNEALYLDTPTYSKES